MIIFSSVFMWAVIAQKSIQMLFTHLQQGIIWRENNLPYIALLHCTVKACVNKQWCHTMVRICGSDTAGRYRDQAFSPGDSKTVLTNYLCSSRLLSHQGFFWPLNINGCYTSTATCFGTGTLKGGLILIWFISQKMLEWEKYESESLLEKS